MLVGAGIAVAVLITGSASMVVLVMVGGTAVSPPMGGTVRTTGVLVAGVSVPPVQDVRNTKKSERKVNKDFLGIVAFRLKFMWPGLPE